MSKLHTIGPVTSKTRKASMHLNYKFLPRVSLHSSHDSSTPDSRRTSDVKPRRLSKKDRLPADVDPDPDLPPLDELAFTACCCAGHILEPLSIGPGTKTCRFILISPFLTKIAARTVLPLEDHLPLGQSWRQCW